ncbi:MAG TPA: PKD domain-containing protein, partial [Gemmataceae bacterium]|nr:PKD domain-containing protein [Gemmataceae bacterium]
MLSTSMLKLALKFGRSGKTRRGVRKLSRTQRPCLEVLEDRDLLSAFLPLGPASEMEWSQPFLPGGSDSGSLSISEQSNSSLQTFGPSFATPFGVLALAVMDVHYEISIGVYDSKGHGLIGYSFNVSLVLPGLELLNGGSSGGASGQSGGSGQDSGPLLASAGHEEVGNEGSPIGFYGSATGGVGSDSYSWNFGDGTPAVSGTLTPTHTYAATGNYTVTLTATDSDGDSSTASTTATVHDLTISDNDPYSGTAGSPISFTASAN